MNLDDAATRRAVERALARGAGASAVRIDTWSLLSGGAIQQNLALDVDVTDGGFTGRNAWVLRTDAASGVMSSRTRVEEFELLRIGHAAGVVTPVPLFVHEGEALPPFFVMSRQRGVAAGHRLTRDGAIADGSALAQALGANLARLHRVAPPQAALAFLGPVPDAPTRRFLAGCRAYLDHWHATFGGAFPGLEWGLRWWGRRAPDTEDVRLVHNDYRTGNYLVDDGRLTAVLDWEFADWGNPLADIGWFCARCWRFARPDREAGGIADIADFLAGYNAVSGTRLTAADTRDWQALAHLRWAIIALQQCERHRSGREPSLELALTGRLLPELELELLRLTPP